MSQATLGEALDRSKAAEGEVRKLSAEINSLLREFQESIGDGKKIKALEDECQEKAQALDRILGDAQEKSSATAAFEHEKSFEEAIGNDTKQGRCWLAAFILLLMLTVAVVIYLYDKAGGFSAVDAVTTPQPQAGSWFPSLQITALRVLFVSILMTTTFWCGRMYKVMKNAALVNRHKNLCLKTFKHFVNATTSADVRDSVLKTAVSTIFITERTGLIAAAPSGEPETNNNVIQLGTSLLEKAASRGS